MIFVETSLPGAYEIELERLEDDRGWFARTFAAEEFEARGMNPAVVHCNASFNSRAGTLRGMHYQLAPYAESKLVRCTRGAIYDVIVDLRPDSPAYLCWFGVELDADGGRSLYVPEGLAHGFQTLVDGSEVRYQMSHEYVPSHARGARWDDPAFGIEWPDAERTISERDRTYPDFAP
jgi:dTDP-4-dehydrorhamnose 3,5-epimerase